MVWTLAALALAEPRVEVAGVTGPEAAAVVGVAFGRIDRLAACGDPSGGVAAITVTAPAGRLVATGEGPLADCAARVFEGATLRASGPHTLRLSWWWYDLPEPGRESLREPDRCVSSGDDCDRVPDADRSSSVLDARRRVWVAPDPPGDVAPGFASDVRIYFIDLDRCARMADRRAPGVSGPFEVAFDGKGGFEVLRDEIGDPVFLACATERMAAWPHASGEPGRVTFRIYTAP